MSRRGMGVLEAAVMEALLWAADDGLTPCEVHGRVADGLGYTTVMTVVTRLWDKGLLWNSTGRRLRARPRPVPGEVVRQSLTIGMWTTLGRAVRDTEVGIQISPTRPRQRCTERRSGTEVAATLLGGGRCSFGSPMGLRRGASYLDVGRVHE